MIITIDGPAGGGKSTLSVLLAKELSFFCLNTGYLYRGLAYVLTTFYGYSNEKLQNPDVVDIQACMQSGNFRYDYIDGLSHVFFTDDITQFLKKIEIGQAAVILAQSDHVRQAIQNYERALVKDKDAIVEGRSCGSVVFPQAQVKFFVTADVQVRALRMVQDQKKRGNQITLEKALELVVLRDQIDEHRKWDPLVVPQGAIILDTTDLTPKQMLDKAVEVVRHAMKK